MGVTTCDLLRHLFIEHPQEIEASARIAPVDEPGQPMVIEGTARSPDGEPARDIVLRQDVPAR